MNKLAISVLGLIIFFTVLINGMILVVSSWFTCRLGMTGISYFCGVFMFWLIFCGILGLLNR